MRLIPDWKDICTKSFSMWSIYLGVLCLWMPEILFVAFEYDTNPKMWFWTAQLLFVFGGAGRIIDQDIGLPYDPTAIKSAAAAGLVAVLLTTPVMSPPTPGLQPPTEPVANNAADFAVSPYTEREFLAEAFPMIAKWEGLRLSSYQDIVGVWTICYGHTRTAGPNQRKTEAECRTLLEHEILEYRHELHAYFTTDTKRRHLTAARDSAFTSLAFNVGWAGAGKSTATRRLNAGQLAGACQALTWWNRAGQRVVRGLVNRRAYEYDKCMIGVA